MLSFNRAAGRPPEFNLTTASTLAHLIGAVALSFFLWIVIAATFSS